MPFSTALVVPASSRPTSVQLSSSKHARSATALHKPICVLHVAAVFAQPFSPHCTPRPSSTSSSLGPACVAILGATSFVGHLLVVFLAIVIATAILAMDIAIGLPAISASPSLRTSSTPCAPQSSSSHCGVSHSLRTQRHCRDALKDDIRIASLSPRDNPGRSSSPQPYPPPFSPRPSSSASSAPSPIALFDAAPPGNRHNSDASPSSSPQEDADARQHNGPLHNDGINCLVRHNLLLLGLVPALLSNSSLSRDFAGRYPLCGNIRQPHLLDRGAAITEDGTNGDHPHRGHPAPACPSHNLQT